MKACRVHHFGPPEVIAFEDVPRPEPAPDELLVRIIAAGVGPWDAWVRAGKSALPQPLPLTLGSDFSGKVVGAFAVDLARARGAHVIGTEVTSSVRSASGPGAEQLIDTTATRFEDVAGSVDAVIDTVGGDLQARSFSVLKPGGVLVSSVSEPDAKLAAARSVRALFMLVNVTTAALTQIAELLDAGALRPRVGSTFPLSEARAAHEMLEGLRPRDPGKIVLLVG
ncbi:MAG TPA: NADP-dependent oxidoreductase [Polyangiaceae bacterium]|jgi:NADPH:quinone reductase-like Zn-dependent oxidoreductase|nr:NADP-dependent oxidoreductase [Polyangiaceae bacterium]